MKNMKNFLSRLEEQTYQVVKEEESKNLAKEDALSLIAEFVKQVKKDFDKKDDQLTILNHASKTLDFYINDIENVSAGGSSSSSSVDGFDDMSSAPTEPVEDMEKSFDEDDDSFI